MLSTLIPPEVEPEQAHCRAKKIRISCENPGQTLVSVVAKPVDVPTEIILNAA